MSKYVNPLPIARERSADEPPDYFLPKSSPDYHMKKLGHKVSEYAKYHKLGERDDAVFTRVEGFMVDKCHKCECGRVWSHEGRIFERPVGEKGFLPRFTPTHTEGGSE